MFSERFSTLAKLFMSDIFTFKQFRVNQADCAMRINTDGILLAALVTCQNPQQILDIGTGTGVLALMMAQKYSQAHVQAVEIEESAAARAVQNFADSPFANRLQGCCADVLTWDTNFVFDLIISNPPFFVNSLKSTSRAKEIARHAPNNFFSLLIKKVAELLAPDGEFWFVLPIVQANELISLAATYQLFPVKQIAIHSNINKTAYRYVIALSRENRELVKENFYIYDTLNECNTMQYNLLLKDYLLSL